MRIGEVRNGAGFGLLAWQVSSARLPHDTSALTSSSHPNIGGLGTAFCRASIPSRGNVTGAWGRVGPLMLIVIEDRWNCKARNVTFAAQRSTAQHNAGQTDDNQELP